MKAKLYGVGVGPGDPELLTLKAARIIRESPVVAIPTKEIEASVAYQIVRQCIPEIDSKELLAIHMPMTKNKEELDKSHQDAAAKITAYLDAGKQVAFLTLGDPCVYSTYMYVHQLVEEQGYPTEILSGITSFCAVAARLNMGLVEKAEPLHIIPSSYQIEDALRLPGTKVLMKAGKKLPAVKEELEQLNAQVWMVENCGMKEEKIYRGAEEININAGYYTLIIVKEK